MMLGEAIVQACASVGVTPPKERDLGKWIRTDAIGKNGKGDGSVILAEERVTAFNWQTGDKATVWLRNDFTPAERKVFAQRQECQRRDEQERAARAAHTAQALVAAAKPATHPYLVRKGFPAERALVVDTASVRRIAGDYLAPGDFESALVVPARIGTRIASAQLIWPDGTKKFLFGGEMGGACHRIAAGADFWLCEGYATAMSIRAALHGLQRRDAVLVCFSASNIVKVARGLIGRGYVAADHDAQPAARPDQFGGMGAGEFFARRAERPYTMPPEVGTDFNDMHQAQGIFSVQRTLLDLLKEGAMR